jgi:NADPH-dependent glutamate synthase beta subunit-like oxidoreductase
VCSGILARLRPRHECHGNDAYCSNRTDVATGKPCGLLGSKPEGLATPKPLAKAGIVAASFTARFEVGGDH